MYFGIPDGRTDRQMDGWRNQSSVGWVTYRFLQVNLQIAGLFRLQQGIRFLLQRHHQFWQRHGVTHIKANAMTLPELVLM
jgi:hypothetical protein